VIYERNFEQKLRTVIDLLPPPPFLNNPVAVTIQHRHYYPFRVAIL